MRDDLREADREFLAEMKSTKMQLAIYIAAAVAGWLLFPEQRLGIFAFSVFGSMVNIGMQQSQAIYQRQRLEIIHLEMIRLLNKQDKQDNPE